MANNVQTFVVAAGCAGLLGACAHVTAGVDVAAASPAAANLDALGLGALGEDLPASMAPAASRNDAARAKRVSIDMPVAGLCARPAARAVVERDLPGLTSRPEYMFFKHMSLRQLQEASGGRMSLAELQQVSDDLGALPATAGASAKPRRRPLLVRIASILP